MLDTQETRTIRPSPVEANTRTDDYVEPQVGQVTAEPKPWYKSKTLWFNTVVAAVGIATSATPYIEAVTDPATFGFITAGIALANSVLRFVTKQPITGAGS